MYSSCRLSWCGPRANNPVFIVREQRSGAANVAKQSTLESRVVCICHIRQSLEMPASKTAPVLHPQSIINSQGRMDWEVERVEREKAKYHNGGFTFCFGSFVPRRKRHKKGTLIKGAMPRKEEKNRNAKAEDGEKTLALAKQSSHFSNAQCSIQLPIWRLREV